MRVTLNTTMAGPNGTATAGETIDLPEKQAESLIAGGYAVALDPAARTRRTATATPDAAAKAEAERLAAEEKAKSEAAGKAA